MAQKELTSISVEQLLCKHISQKAIRNKARAVGFIKRMRKVEPVSFLLSIIFSVGQNNNQSLASIRRYLVLSGATKIVRSSFWDRLNQPLEQLISWLLSTLQKENSRVLPNYKGVLKTFTDVIAFDCTVLVVPRALAIIWPATRKQIEAAVKIYTEIRALTGELLKHHIVRERTCDHRFCRVNRWKKGALYLFDLGFVSGFAWRTIQLAEAFF